MNFSRYGDIAAQAFNEIIAGLDAIKDNPASLIARYVQGAPEYKALIKGAVTLGITDVLVAALFKAVSSNDADTMLDPFSSSSQSVGS